MTFHLRDLVRWFKAFGTPTNGQVLKYNSTTARPEWGDAGGDYATIAKSSDQTFLGRADSPFYTEEDDEELFFEVEANSIYHIDGVLIAFDDVEWLATNCALGVPAGTGFNFYVAAVGGTNIDNWGDAFNSSWGGVGEMGFRNGVSTTNLLGTHPASSITGLLKTAGTAGTVRVKIRNYTGNNTHLQGLRAGSFIKFKKLE